MQPRMKNPLTILPDALLLIQIALINAFNRVSVPTKQIAGSW